MADVVPPSSANDSVPSSSSTRPISGHAHAHSHAHPRDEEAAARRAPPGKDATPEELAKYELERKRVQKYKEDKLKARRDHARMILESHAQAKRRAALGKQSEFLANLEFRNKLPDLPFDTKFLQYPQEPERLIQYKPNTLEMDYVYEVHEEPNLGLKIDLIDPAKYEAPKDPPKLEVGDEQVLRMKDTTKRNGRPKERPSVTWLRRTEYMGTDLSETTHNFKTEVEIQMALREGTENALQEVVQVTLEDRAEASFHDIEDEATLLHPFKKSLKPRKVWEVFPDQLLSANKYAILAYDLLPSDDVNGKSMLDRENRAMLCGVSKKSPNSDVVQGSIMLPNARDEEEKDSSEPSSERYAYFREYQVAIDLLENERGREDAQHVLFMLDRTSDHFTYADVSHRIQLRKTKLLGDEKRRGGTIVHRRDFTETELDNRRSMQFLVGGLYDDALDVPEQVREHKKRRANEDDEGKAEEHEGGSPAVSSGSDSE